MRVFEKNGLKILKFEILEHEAGLVCGVSTRSGGVSKGQFASLNLGCAPGENAVAVEENRGRFFRALGADPARAADMAQKHTANVSVIEDEAYLKTGPAGGRSGADALVTTLKNTPLLALSADCALTVFYDRAHGALAVAHSGWRGAALNIYSAVINVMKLRYGAEPADLIAGVGPMISANYYPVREDFLKKLQAFYPGGEARKFITLREGRHHFSLRELLKHQLAVIGVEKYEFMRLCTYAQKELFYSWRRDADTGRFGLMAMLI